MTKLELGNEEKIAKDRLAPVPAIHDVKYSFLGFDACFAGQRIECQTDGALYRSFRKYS